MQSPECVDAFMHLVPNVRIKSVFVHKGIRYVSICFDMQRNNEQSQRGDFVNSIEHK